MNQSALACNSLHSCINCRNILDRCKFVSPREIVEKVGPRAKNSNEGGGGGERWKGCWRLRASVSSSSLPLPIPFLNLLSLHVFAQ